jgi:hypothetical protein
VNRVETEFRRIESRLDELVGKAELDLRSQEVRVEDWSARNYHYNNSYLFWSHSFLKEWIVGVERARITVCLSYHEPLNPEGPCEIELSWRAELFQQGQQSRIDKGSKSTFSLADIERQGIYSLVEAAILEAKAYLPKAL